MATILLVIVIAIVSFIAGGIIFNKCLAEMLVMQQDILKEREQMLEKYDSMLRRTKSICETDNKIIKYYKVALALALWNADAE